MNSKLDSVEGPGGGDGENRMPLSRGEGDI